MEIFCLYYILLLLNQGSNTEFVDVQSHADTPVNVSVSGCQPLSVYEFASALMAEGEYYRAITEFKRFLFLTREQTTELKDHALFNVAECYFRGEQLAEAKSAFKRFIAAHPASPLASRARFKIGRILAVEGNYDQAREAFTTLKESTPARDPLAQEATEEIAWTHFAQFRFDEGLPYIDNILEETDSRRLADLRTGALEGTQIKLKKPWLAGFLTALLPGTGHFYLRRWQDGLVALALNGAFGYGIYEAFEEDMPVVAGVLIFFEAGWYFGSIYGSVSTARIMNHDRLQRHYEMLDQSFHRSLN